MYIVSCSVCSSTGGQLLLLAWDGGEGCRVYGKLRVKLQLVTSHGDIVVRKMEVVEDTPQPGQAKPVNALSVTLMQLTSWPEQELPHPTAILSLVDHLTTAQRSSSTKHTVVMCRFVCI